MNKEQTTIHDQFESKVRKALEKDFTVLPTLTYHEVLGRDSEAAWDLRKSNGMLSQTIRSQPDILVKNSNGYVFGIDIKTKIDSKYSNYCLEAMPIISAIMNQHDIFYVLRDFTTNITRVLPVQEMVNDTPTHLYVFSDHPVPKDRVTMLAKSIWPGIKIIVKDRKSVIGSGDHFLIFENLDPYYTVQEGLEKMQELI